jgi:hypothetical protein
MPPTETSTSRTRRIAALAGGVIVAGVLTAVVYFNTRSVPPQDAAGVAKGKTVERDENADLPAKISATKARFDSTLSSLQEATRELEAARQKALQENPELAKAYETSKLYSELATASSYEASEVSTWWRKQYIDRTWKPEMLSARNKILLQEWQASLDDPQSGAWLKSMIADEGFLHEVKVLGHEKTWTDPQAAIPEIPPPGVLAEALAAGRDSLQLTAAESAALPERIRELMREQAEIRILGEAAGTFYENNQGPEVAALETKRMKLSEVATNLQNEMNNYQRLSKNHKR